MATLSGPRSKTFGRRSRSDRRGPEAENRLYAQQAILEWLAEEKE